MNRWTLAVIGALLGTVTVWAAQQPQTGMPGMGQMGMMQQCPMAIPGVEVTVADTTAGVAVTFTAKAADVNELQRRVARMANMHKEMPNATRMGAPMIAGDVKYEAIPNGARLTLTPKDPARLAEVRAQVRTHVEHMKKGGCTMMEEMMHGMMQGRGGVMRGNEDPAPHHN